MSESPFKMKGWSPFTKKQTDAEFMAAAEKQKSDAINRLKQKALDAGKSDEEATKLATTEYHSNI